MARLTPAASDVPVDQILQARAAYPIAKIGFEVELAATESWAALRESAAIFGSAGLALEGLRCSPNGHILCRLQDRRSFDPQRLAQDLARAPDLALVRWTILLRAA